MSGADQGGSRTARDAMRVMFRVWNTEEMPELVEWMRAYNEARPNRTVRTQTGSVTPGVADTVRAR